MLWTEYRPVIKIGSKGALGSHEIRPIHSPPSFGQSITTYSFIIIEDKNTMLKACEKSIKQNKQALFMC